MDDILQIKHLSKSILYDLQNGKANWDDEKVQFFIPVGLYFTDFDLLKTCAENILVKEDAEIVKNFLDKVESLCSVNEQGLNAAVEDKLENIFKGMI